MPDGAKWGAGWCQYGAKLGAIWPKARAYRVGFGYFRVGKPKVDIPHAIASSLFGSCGFFWASFGHRWGTLVPKVAQIAPFRAHFGPKLSLIVPRCSPGGSIWGQSGFNLGSFWLPLLRLALPCAVSVQSGYMYALPCALSFFWASAPWLHVWAA